MKSGVKGSAFLRQLAPSANGSAALDWNTATGTPSINPFRKKQQKPNIKKTQTCKIKVNNEKYNQIIK